MILQKIDWLETEKVLWWEEKARAWLFTYLRKKYWWFCYKIEDAWIAQKPFDSIIDVWNNERYFIEFKYDRHKKHDPDKIKARTRWQMEPIQMAILVGLKNIKSTVHVITYIQSTKKFLLLTY